MRGTEVTEEQKAHALAFLERGGNRVPERSIITRDQLVTMMAWYAAVRGKGDGSGNFVVNGKERK